MQPFSFYLITDTHFYKNSLGCYGKEYDEFMRYEQKCYAETESINNSVFEWLEKADEADTVLIAGDLSFNGERASHEGFVKLLEKLKKAGKRVFVVTADHDCSAHPFGFNENGRFEPEGIQRDELFDIYNAYGFGDAIAADREHLSYVAQLADGVRLLALNNDGSRDGIRNFDQAQIEWIKQQTAKAREDGQMMIAMNHFPLLPPQPLFTIIGSTMQKQSAKAVQLLADEGVGIVFTGHMHQQSINEYVTEKGNKIYDVCTGSVIADPAVIRHITIKDENTVEIKSIPTPDFEWDTKGKDCKQYLKDTFDAMIVNLLEDMVNDTPRVLRKVGIGTSKGAV
ncbi:MAG: metallophosphoesterase, partial [Clostridia bacterium]|nr:metallophosphoesterase [Clostridia bacterium]